MSEAAFTQELAAFDETQARALVQERFLDGIDPFVPKVTQTQESRRLDHALVEYGELITLELPEPKRHLAWLREGSLVMVFGQRGVGKTMLQLALTAALTTGRDFLCWPVTQPAGVLYCDGEMPTEELRTRLTGLLPEKPSAPLFFLTGDLYYRRCQHDLVLTRPETREQLLALLDAHPEIKVVVLDNISCLFPGLDEDKKKDWEPIAAWLVTLRRRGLAVVLVHHAGKGGQQWGTSGREDSLDVVIQLSRPTDYRPEEGCHFELSFSKSRSVHGEAIKALDVRMEVIDSRPTLTSRTLEKSKEDQCRDLLQDGVESLTELAEMLGVSRGYACKLKKKVQGEGAQNVR
jgi:putative DNA primase/helicase